MGNYFWYPISTPIPISPSNLNHTIDYLSESYHNITDQTELKISNDSFLISPGDNRTCFEIESVDDTIIEDIKVVNVTVIPVNLNDQVMDGVVSVTVMDNDSM